MTTDNPEYQCQNCEKRGPRSQFQQATNLLERIAPGEPFTDSQCPNCGALAHPVEPDATTSDRLLLLEMFSRVQKEREDPEDLARVFSAFALMSPENAIQQANRLREADCDLEDLIESDASSDHWHLLQALFAREQEECEDQEDLVRLFAALALMSPEDAVQEANDRLHDASEEED